MTAAAGLGKSRLLVEAARLLTGRGFRVYEGEAQAFGTRSSYGAWHGIWAAALDVGIDDPADQQRRQVAARVAALDPTLSGRVPLLGAALGLAIPDNDLTASLSPKLRKASLEALLVSLVTRLTEDGPMALLLEDAQWLDPLSVDLLHALAAATAELPVLIVVAHRTSDDEDDPLAALADLGHVSEIALVELDRAACTEIVAAKLAQLGDLRGEVPEALLDVVLDRAEGNPFYLEELLTFVHTRGVDPADGAALRALDLPDSLHSLVLSRIDTVAEGPRRYGQGGQRDRAALPDTDAARGLPGPGHGDRAGPAPGRAAPDRADRAGAARRGQHDEAHLFKHVITAQAAYEATPVALRESLHERVGAYLEEVGEIEASLDVLAYHYGRGADLVKKREFLLRAGDRARTDYANAAAIDYYARAAPLVSRRRAARGAASSRRGPRADRAVGRGRGHLRRRARPGRAHGTGAGGSPGTQGAGRGGSQAGPLRRGRRTARRGRGGVRRARRPGRGR